jgi:hypothetical protein
MKIRKVFLRSEKCLACDLQPGDFFVLDAPDVEELLNGEAIVMSVLMRTNADGGDMEDPETIVYRLTVLMTHPAKPMPAMIDPHSPPGLKE